MEPPATTDGSDRRTFLRALAAAGVIGAIEPIGGAAAQTDVDAYHQQLRTELRDGEGLPTGEFAYGTTEETAIETFSLNGAGSGTETEFSVDDGDVPITVGDRIAVDEEPENNYDYTYQGFTPADSFSEGDVLLGVAYVRSETDGAEVQAGFKYRYTNPDGETAFGSTFVQESATIEPTDEWARYYFPIEVGAKPDGSNFEPYMEFWTGFTEQTVEFGGMALVDYSDADVAVDDLPAGAPGRRNPLLDYEGREEGAQWRQDARDRIEEIRKADAEIAVVDGEGNAVPDATVDLEMVEHAFDFGSAVSVPNVVGEDDADETYREVFLDRFNKAVVENGMKWPAWENDEGWDSDNDDVLATLEWLAEHDVPARGHCLLWEQYTADGGGGMSIEDGASLSGDELVAQVTEKITGHAERFDDQVVEWDMHNHPIWQSNFRDRDDVTWQDVLDWWAAADAATDRPLYTNEMGNVAGDFFRSQHLEFVQRLVGDGAPIDGIGFMGHVQFPNGNVTPPPEILSTFDQFAETGLPILITEFDVELGSRDNDAQVAWQADLVRDFLIAAFSHEAVAGVMSWGFWSEDHWRPSGAYYDADWNLRPHGERFVDLVFDQWWTEDRGTADSSGVYATRGFEGTYEITASDGRRTGTTTATIDEDAGQITVEIAPDSIADVDLDVADHTLRGDESVDLDVTVTNEDGEALLVPADAIAYESTAPAAVAVDDDGTVFVASTGAGTVTATVSAYDDTAVASARFAAFGEPTLHDPAEDFSLAASREGMEVTRYQSRHGDEARFRTTEASEPGSVTYEVADGIAAFRAITYVNNQEFDGENDVYEGLTFEVSPDGSDWTTVAAEPETVVETSDENSFYAKRRYLVTDGVPDDATYLRVTMSPSQNVWAANVGSIDVWAATADVSGDATGPTILVDGLQDGDSYEAPHPASVSIADDDSSVTNQSVTLDGEAWDGGQLRARGDHRLQASATSEGGVTTNATLAFEIVEEEAGDLNARMVVSETEATVGDRLTFRVRDATGNDTWIESLSWSFDDGTDGDGWWQAHRFAEPGAYTVELTATDNEGTATTDSVVIWVSDLDADLATVRPTATDAAVGERIEFRAEDTTDEGRWIDDLDWEFGDGTTAEGWWAAHEYDEPGSYTVVLTATDNLGYSTTDEVEVTVE